MSHLENSPSTDSTSSSYSWFDEWPSDFDGTGLLERLENSEQPVFRFNVKDVFDEVHKNLRSKVFQVPRVGSGSNCFGLHVVLENGLQALLRIRRCDVNWPGYCGFSVDEQFEAATYRLLRAHHGILVSNLLYYRGPVQRKTGDRTSIPNDLIGRQLFVFEKAEGANNVWPVDAKKRLAILTQCASIRAALFRSEVPLDFVKLWLPQRPPNPKLLPNGIQPTRDFAIDLLVAKVEEMIKKEGDMIGWESDHNVVGRVAANAKVSILRLIPLILPRARDGGDFYRLVLEHGDFGIHNMTITDPASGPPTSLYDCETGHIVPAILSDPQVATQVDLEIDSDGCPFLSRLMDNPTAEYLAEYQGYANHYFEVLDEQAPGYLPAIKTGKHARHLWFALKSWRGDDPEGYFGKLGSWADNLWRELTAACVEIN
ncbi:hypothetical protein C8R47DRAFT_963396 [Mycena vitilis]|nr:hypothetical protein C8R47DRAFT_963396 [Mycena vitilis]